MSVGGAHRVVVALAALAVVGTVAGAGLAGPFSEEAGASMQVEAFSLNGGGGELGADEQVGEINYEDHGNSRVTWEGLPEEPAAVEVTMEVRGPDGEWETLYTDRQEELADTDPEEGQAPITLGGGLFADTDWSADDFDPDHGEEIEHTIDHRYTVSVLNADGEVIVEETVEEEVTYAVSRVETEDSTGGDSGSSDREGNSGAESTAELSVYGEFNTWPNVDGCEPPEDPCHLRSDEWN